MRAQSAPPSCLDAQLQAVADIREAARALGVRIELVAIPDASDAQATADIMRRRLAHVDRVLIIGHGPETGDGKIHAIARACGLPVLGPDGLAIALSYDKLLSRQQLAVNNLPVPQTVTLDDGSRDTRALDRLGWPCVVKPRRGCFGQGVERLTRPEQLDEIERVARETHGETQLLLERNIDGRDISVVMLGGEVLGIAELEREFSSHGLQTTSMSCPADLDSICRAGIEHLARRSCAALGLETGLVRVDLLLSSRHNEVVLEVEALPPMHRASVVARVARAAGLSYPQLLARVLSESPRTQVSKTYEVAAQLHA